MSYILLKSFCRRTIWGGDRLFDWFPYYKGKIDNIAEAWVLSAREDGDCKVVGGEFDGMPFSKVVTLLPEGSLGARAKGGRFPLLVKIIDARRDLSLQVHPDDAYAAAHGIDSGKTEAWYIMDAKEGAKLLYGVKKGVGKEKFAADCADERVLGDVNSVPVKKGDVAYIPAGTLHAICDGILLCEVQQNCDTTYRIYDYGRPDANGKPRDLDVEQSLECLDFDKTDTDLTPAGARETIPGGAVTKLAGNEFFEMSLLEVDGELPFAAGKESFASLVVLSGEGQIRQDGRTDELCPGSSVFVPAGDGDLILSGKMELMLSGI